jgi:hypothetical protein
MRNLQIETITTATGKQDVIRDIETVNAILKDNAQLEASLRLAVECLATVVHNDKEAQKQLMEMGYPMSLHTSTDTMNSTLSALRANHPQLMEGEK